MTIFRDRLRWRPVFCVFSLSAALFSLAACGRSEPTEATVSVTQAAAPASNQSSPTAQETDADKTRSLSLQAKQVSGDFDEILKARNRRIIVLVTYSRTLYFNDKGQERGLVAEMARDFERYINLKYKTGARPITVVLAPVTREKLLPALTAGFGDIAAASLTVTPERLKLVDFVVPEGIGGTTSAKAVNEVVVTGPKSPPIATVEDLAGKTVDVRKSTSYYESLVALNDRFKKEGKAEIKLKILPDAIQDEDMLEMVNVGLLGAIVSDDWLVHMWAPVLPKIKINEGAAVREQSDIGWAIRKSCPKLQAEISNFFEGFVKKHGLVRVRQAQYGRRIKALRDPTGTKEWERFEQTLKLFEKYGQQYNFDPLMLAAQGFQESRLDQNAKSHVGAIGIMQIMPATGEELKVGDIHVTESNIHGGAKYMDKLMSRYFQDAKFSETDRTLFAFACYNAGPGSISRMRKEAAKRGLDQDQWFNNVELVTAEKIGVETTTYVRNIYKYYVGYKLTEEIREEQRKARAQAAPTENTSANPATADATAGNSTDKWLGQWNGPEGTFLVLSKSADKYKVKIQSLDGPATYEGVRAGGRINFTRNGKTESIRAGRGQDTGMKWLMDKKNCLVIKAGEGFCRD
jgi:membrane-bound lytic murein transglycosylase MltF